MFFGLLSSLFMLAIFGGLIFGFVRLLGGGKRRTAGEDTAVHVRRALVYGALFIAVVVAAFGATTLLSEVFGGRSFGDTGSRVARGLSFLIVAVPVTYLLLRYVRRSLDERTGERRSAAWAAYLNLALGTSLVVTMVAVVQSVSGLFGDWDGESLAFLIVWGAIWWYHWFNLLARYDTPGDVHLAVGSIAGLGGLVAGLGAALVLPLNEAYRALGDSAIVARYLGEDLTVAVAAALVGALVWWWHWLAHYVHADRDALWHAYVIVVGVLAGTLAAVGSAVWTLGAVLVWLFGDPSPGGAIDFFEFLPTAFVVLLIGALTWWYHRSVLHSEGTPERTEPIRVYDYVMAAVGVLAAAAGSTVIVIALIDALTSGSVDAGGETATNPLIIGLTLLATGVPLWWGFWRKIEDIAAVDETERPSETRKVYLFGIFGVGGLTAFISLIVLLYGILDPLLNGELGTAAIRDARASMALVLTVGGLAWFHFTVWRTDRTLLGADEPDAPAVDVVLVTDDDHLGDELRKRLRGRVEVWHRLTAGGTAADPDALADMVLATGERHVLVVTGETEPIVVPFES